MDIKRLLGGFFMIAAVTLVGCGGGGGTNLMIGEERATKEGIEALMSERDTAVSERDAAEGERDAANMTLGEVRMALDLEEDADQDAIMDAIMALEDNALADVRTALDLEDDATPAMIVAAIDTLQMEQPPTADPMSEALAMAIFLPNKDGVGAPYDDPKRPGQAKDEAPTFEAGGDMGVTRVDGDVLNKNDSSIEDAEEFASVDESRAAIDEFPVSSVYTRTEETNEGMVTDTLTLYSDVTDRTHAKYLEYFADTNQGSAPENRPAAVSDMGTGTENGVLTFTKSSISDGEAGLFMADAFPSGDSQTFTYVDDDPTTDTNEEKRGGREFEGTFAGVEGEYSCTGTTCSAKTRADGSLSMLDGTWKFTPDATDVLVRDVIPDADYLSFGYWVQATEKEDGTTTYGVSAFYGGSQSFDMATVGSLRGTATYEGRATGLYVKKTYDTATNDFVPSSSGQFTADAALTASFGGDDVAQNKKFSVEGTVTNFMDGNDMIDPNWMVTLGKSSQFSSSATMFSGKTSTGVNSTEGGWEGEFFGNHVPTNPVTEAVKQYPEGVAGEFNAHFSPGDGKNPGHVIGAFGATR